MPDRDQLRALVVTARPPIVQGGDFNGGAQRFLMFMRAIAAISAEITLVHLVLEHLRAGLPSTDALSAGYSARCGIPVAVEVVPIVKSPVTFWSYYGAGIASVHGNPQWHPMSAPNAVAAVERHYAAQPDIVFAHRLAGMCPIMQGGLRHPCIVFDLDDLEHRISFRGMLRPPHWPGKMLYAAQLPAILLGERKAAAMAAATFVCSETDKRYVERLGIARNVQVIPNAIEVPTSAPSVAPEMTLLFLGGYTYSPNADAAERLVTRIFPLIRRSCPQAQLLIAGPAPELLPSYRSPPERVSYLGFVPDLEALYARSRVICCPIQVGGGTRFKLIEAAVYARPIVSSRVGAEGLDLRPGIDLLLADSDTQLAESCLRLLQDDEACRRLGQSARDRAQSRYEISAVEQQLVRALVVAAGRAMPALPESDEVPA